VVGGFVITPEFTNQINHVFSRIIFALRLHFVRPPTSPSTASDGASSASKDCSIQQWLNGAKIQLGALSAVITLIDDASDADAGRNGQLFVTCRGPVDQRRQLFFMQVLLL